MNFLLSFDSIHKNLSKYLTFNFYYLLSAALACKSAFSYTCESLVNRNMRQYKPNIFFPNESILVKIITKKKIYNICLRIHIESKFNLGINIWIIDLKETMYEFFQVDVAVSVKIKDRKESFTNDSR